MGLRQRTKWGPVAAMVALQEKAPHTYTQKVGGKITHSEWLKRKMKAHVVQKTDARATSTIYEQFERERER